MNEPEGKEAALQLPLKFEKQSFYFPEACRKQLVEIREEPN